MVQIAAFLYGAFYVALLVLLGPFIAVLWLVAGALTVLAVRLPLMASWLVSLFLGYGVAFATLLAEQELTCQAPHCQTVTLATSLFWFLTGLLAAGMAFVGVWLVLRTSLMRWTKR